MQLSCTLPRPGPRLRAVIVIIIYLAISRLAPGEIAPMAAGSILALLAAAPGRGREDRHMAVQAR